MHTGSIFQTAKIGPFGLIYSEKKFVISWRLFEIFMIQIIFTERLASSYALVSESKFCITYTHINYDRTLYKNDRLVLEFNLVLVMKILAHGVT